MADNGAPVIVALPAEIDITNAGQVYDRLSAALASGAPLIIADLTVTAVCDAAGVRRRASAGNPARRADQAGAGGAWRR